jgi:Holliday junction resolvasome RuvABC endonuclease subunit
LIKTKKNMGKEKNLRVSTDDARRLELIWEQFDSVAAEFDLKVVAAEVYQPFKKASSAWKTAMVYGLVLAWAKSRGVPFWCYLPSDLKRAFGMKASASKEEVAGALYRRVPKLGDQILAHAKTNREHLSDAAGHAYLAVSALTSLGL